MSNVPIPPGLQKQIAALRAEMEFRTEQMPPIQSATRRRQHLQVRLAITVADGSDNPTYPVPEQTNKYKIKFVDTDFARQLGNETLQLVERGDPSDAFDNWVYSTQYLYEKRPLIVTRYVGKGERTQKGEWYTQIPDSWTGVTTSTIPAGSQGTADIEIYDKSTVSVSAVKCNYNEEIGSGVRVSGIYHEDGRVLIITAECEEDPNIGITNPTPNP